MDRVVVISVLLLVAFTWLLYRLIVLLEPRGEASSIAHERRDGHGESTVLGVSHSCQKPIAQRLRK